jgi:hypothetical protein
VGARRGGVNDRSEIGARKRGVNNSKREEEVK